MFNAASSLRGQHGFNLLCTFKKKQTQHLNRSIIVEDFSIFYLNYSRIFSWSKLNTLKESTIYLKKTVRNDQENHFSKKIEDIKI